MSEIEYFWSPPSPSWSWSLFVVCRYFGLLGPIPVFFEYFGMYPEDVSFLIYRLLKAILISKTAVSQSIHAEHPTRSDLLVPM